VPRNPTEPNPTRQRILEAGLALWQEEPPAELFGGYSVARVARAAGVTRATFYAYWPSTEAYFDDLLEHLTAREPEGYRPGVGQAVARIGSAGPEVSQQFLDACAMQLTGLLDDPALRVRLGFLSCMDDAHVAAKLREHYRSVERRTYDIYAHIRTSWGRENRPEITDVQLQAVFTALMEGLAARHRIDPEAVPFELYGRISVALLLVLTRRFDDPRTLDDLLVTINSWPAVGLRLRARRSDGGEPPPGPVLDATGARRAVEAARRELAATTWQNLTMGELAAVSNVPEEALLRAFGSKAGLAMAIFKLNVHDRYRTLRHTGEPVTDLRRMLAVSLDELRRAPALTQSVVLVHAGAASVPVPGIVDWDPIPTLLEQVRLTQEAGQLSADLDAATFTGTLLRVMLADSAPPTTAPWSGADAVELLLRGAGAPPLDGATTLSLLDDLDVGTEGDLVRVLDEHAVAVPQHDPFLA
jgi:AcrR family transcriptional regulator